MLNISEIQTIKHDVIVIGAGGAGLRAAIECSAQGLNTGIVCKSLLGKAHTVMAEGGLAAAMGNVNPHDNWKIHFRDTMRGGKFLNQWRMAELHAKEAPARVRELEEWGAVFDRTKDGLINQRNFGGHRYPRLVHVGDRTGLELIRTLQDHGIHQGIEVHMECTALDLLKDGDRVAGVVAYWRETGRFVIFQAKAVILATGGACKAWSINSNSWEYTGDGLAMAYRAGGELMDVEFVQFHPTGMVWPPSVRGTLVTEAVRGDGGILLNNKGKRFMFGYIPEKFAPETADTEEEANRWLKGDTSARRPPELLTRDVVARAIKKEVEEGRGSPHGGVFLDIANRLPADRIKKQLPSMYHQFKELAGLDITKEPMEVGPTAHYWMGGIRVDSDTQETRVPGLFACGECAAGLHGANRLGGNSLSDLVVFGRRAGLGAKAYISKLSNTPKTDAGQIQSIVKGATDILNRESGKNPYLIHEDLQNTMQKYVGILRIEEELQTGLVELERLKKDTASVKAHGTSQFNPGWSEAIDLRNLLICAEAVNRAALERQESRGGHSRLDYPGERDEGLTFNVIISKGNDGMNVRKEPRKDPPKELASMAYATLEALEGRHGS
ncbi:MAG: fumarate reductase/succinate dehydrogenase flavoprotein subunit [Deltaproteobacteria bacterium RIFCSPLOWO2_02_FULL_50_16]|nr:MAG: fumarate reductase/succinate dehydrogenase flavoprotein subunit [Deltaproteobacteria bacterium RIFCSPLOWO2_02_FULL_50_16]